MSQKSLEGLRRSQKSLPGGFYEDGDPDEETSSYFPGSNQSNLFRDGLGSNSPSQQGFGPTQGFPHQAFNRSYNGSSNMQRSTPTSFMQPQSPNRNLLGSVSQRSYPQMNSGNFPIQQQQNQLLQNNKRVSSFGSNYSQQAQLYGSNFPQSFVNRPGSGTQGGDMNTSNSALDFSSTEFPSLSGRSVPQPSFNAPRNYVGMVGSTNPGRPVDCTSEFSMQQEDFPALPGTASTRNVSGGDAPRSLLPENLFSQEKDSLKPEGKITRTAEQASRMNTIPAGMIEDQFGIVGLLTFMRATESNSNVIAVSPGIELNSLGITNLAQGQPLTPTFLSPFAPGVCRPQDLDMTVPIEYMTNSAIRERLAPIAFRQYGEDLLFFLFYNYPGEFFQLAASSELYSRDWRYHKEDQIWLTRAPGHEPSLKTTQFERGQYYVFDPQQWRKVLKDMHLEYCKLEEKPMNQIQNVQQQRQQPQIDPISAH